MQVSLLHIFKECIRVVGQPQRLAVWRVLFPQPTALSGERIVTGG